MNDKNTKNQHSAQALDDDALENVAGGYTVGHAGFDLNHPDESRWTFFVNSKEEAYLNDLGYSKVKGKYGNVFVDSNGNIVPHEQIRQALDNGGFSPNIRL